MSGLRIWLSDLLRRPILLLHERVDGVRGEINHDLEILSDDIQHRARRMEVRIAAWGVAAAMLAVSGLFLLIGLWLGLNKFIGPVGASFALAGLFGLLAVIPVVVLPRELSRIDASGHPHSN